MQDNYRMLIDMHKSRFSKINELATHKSGNYVLMAPVANKFGPSAAQAFQTAHTQQYPQVEHSFLNLINPNVLHTNTTPTVTKAVEAATVACKQPNSLQNPNFFNETIMFRSPKHYTEMRIEKDKKAKLIAQQQQQQQIINNASNTQINITATASSQKPTVSQQQTQQQQQGQTNPQKPTITTQLSSTGQKSNISITPTQSVASSTSVNQTTVSSPSSPTVSNLLNNSNVTCKTATNIRNNTAVSSHLTLSSNTTNLVKSSQQQQQTSTYYQVQQQPQQRITLDISGGQSTPSSPIANLPKSGQQPLRLFQPTAKSQTIKHGTTTPSIIQQSTSATTLLKQATSNTQLIQSQKKDVKQQQQQQLPQIATIAATSTGKIEQTKPTTMIISSNPSYTTTTNNPTQISIQSTPTTLITTTSTANKTPAVLVKQNSAIKTATIASPPLTISSSLNSGATLITNTLTGSGNQTSYQQISRQQSTPSSPQTNSIVLTSIPTSTNLITTQASASANTLSTATFTPLVKQSSTVNTITLSLPQQKIQQASKSNFNYIIRKGHKTKEVVI